MLQRKQSLFLLISVALQIAITQFNYFYASILGVQYQLDSFGLQNVSVINESESDYKQTILIIAVVALSAVATFQFKDRKLQIKLLNIALLLHIVQLSYIGFSFYRMSEQAPTDIELGIAPFLVIGSALFSFLALKFIKKDEELVRSVDRIR